MFVASTSDPAPSIETPADPVPCVVTDVPDSAILPPAVATTPFASAFWVEIDVEPAVLAPTLISPPFVATIPAAPEPVVAIAPPRIVVTPPASVKTPNIWAPEVAIDEFVSLRTPPDVYVSK